MEILRQLKLAGANEVTAVLVRDGDEEYPVFLDSLLNTVMCDELLNSGWQLCGLPYDFRKDGMKLSNLPVEDFNPTTSEEQDMWDLLGEKLSNEELKSRMSTAAIEYMQLPDAEYTIFTREEFLQYLNRADNVDIDSDFLPINYFVHPNALFSYEEYVSGEFSGYLEIMARRRAMSYTKFNMLLDWCFSKGLSKNFKPIDFLDFYYQWGIDGLNMPLINKKRETRHRILGASDVSMDMLHNQYIYRHEIGLVDNTGTILLPEESKNIKWTPKVTNQQIYEEGYLQLKENDTKIVDLNCRTSMESTILEGLQVNIQYDENIILVGDFKIPGLYVYPNDSSNKPISPEYWNPENYDKLKTICYLRALAQTAIKKCIQPTNASSFKALTLSGCSPYSALVYYVKNAKLDENNSNLMTGKVDVIDDGMPTISLNDVDDYIAGTEMREDKFDVLDNFVKGVSNIDHIYEGIRAEAEYSADTMYTELYAVHYVLDVSLDELYEKIMNIGDAEELTFTGNGYKHTIHLPRLHFKVNGYNCDLEDYRDAALHDACEYIYVTKVAREIGSLEAKRHVGFECLTLYRDSRAEALLNVLRDMYKTRVETNVIGIQNQNEYKKLVSVFAAARFFEAAIKGTITFPRALGGEVLKVTANEQQAYLSCLKTNIESTVIYCNTNIETDGTFRRYCVNAYITPEYVIPKSTFSIEESSFIALWRDFSAVPDVRAKLVEKGLIPANHVAWDNRYFVEKLCYIDMLSNMTLDFYNENANKFRDTLSETEEFVAAPHPIEYLNPGLFPEEENNNTIPLRTGKPSFPVGDAYVRKSEDFSDILSINKGDGNDDLGFSIFKGYDADDFYLVNDVLKTVFPPSTKPITLYPPMKFYTKETGMCDYTEIAKLNPEQYAIKNIRGRKYILRDIKGKYWEVMI